MLWSCCNQRNVSLSLFQLSAISRLHRLLESKCAMFTRLPPPNISPPSNSPPHSLISTVAMKSPPRLFWCIVSTTVLLTSFITVSNGNQHCNQYVRVFSSQPCPFISWRLRVKWCFWPAGLNKVGHTYPCHIIYICWGDVANNYSSN